MPPLVIAFEKYYDELTAHVVRKVGDPTTAADIVQDIYAKIANYKDTHNIDNPRAFLYKIASNMVIDHVRKDQTHAQYVEYTNVSDDHVAQIPSIETELIHRQRLSLLKEAVDTLPPKCRQVFVMRKFEHKSPQEIMDELGITRGMIEKHVRNALVHCLNYMDQYDRGGN